jgi:hypothetical protein
MYNKNTNKRVETPIWIFVFLVISVVLFSPTSANSVDIVARKDFRNTLEAQGSFNFARREIFRDLYGNGVTFAVRYERAINDKIGWGIRVSRVQLSDFPEYAIVKLKYRDFNVAPMMTYNLLNGGGFRLFPGAGLGLSFRKITLDSYRLDQNGNPSSPYEAYQTEASMYGLLMLGADLGLSGKLFLGARVTYGRHFSGDVTTGDLGDTGGFNFGGSFGIRF